MEKGGFDDNDYDPGGSSSNTAQPSSSWSANHFAKQDSKITHRVLLRIELKLAKCPCSAVLRSYRYDVHFAVNECYVSLIRV